DKLPSRYREPLVLCYLEGLTRDEAAARLRVPLTTLKSQLDRGRKRLGDALTRRGVVVGAGLLALVATSAAGASLAAFVQAVLKAVSGSPPNAVAALAKGVAVNALTGKSISSLAVVLITAAALSLALNFAPTTAARPLPDSEKSKTGSPPAVAEDSSISGRVVDSDGNPVTDASIILANWTAERKHAKAELTKTDADGRFTFVVKAVPDHAPERRTLVASAAGFGPDWIKVSELRPGVPITFRLPPDLPVRGKVVDLEGKPISRAKVSVKAIQTTPTE